jgi:hypothetical protein
MGKSLLNKESLTLTRPVLSGMLRAVEASAILKETKLAVGENVEFKRTLMPTNPSKRLTATPPPISRFLELLFFF